MAPSLCWLPLAAAALMVASAPQADAQSRRNAPAKAPVFFTSELTLDEMRGKQAVIETDRGEVVLDLLPEKAPNHVAHFIDTARKGEYDGTTFHRAVRYGILQGGDPLSRDPGQRAKVGTGGFHRLRAEPNDEKNVRGTVSGVVLVGKPDSAGAQFLINVADQPRLDGRYTVFARVNDGFDLVQAASAEPTDDQQMLVTPLRIRRVTIRDTPPVPFAADSDADLARYRVTLQTSKGDITLEVWPDRSPVNVRQFLRLAAAGVYDATAVHRVAPGFVIQTGSLDTRATPLRLKQRDLVRSLPGEFSDVRHDRGIVSMARGEALDSATTSFFICLAPAPALDGKYSVLGRVVDGDAVLDAIAAVPLSGEAPVERIDLVRVVVMPTP